MGTAEISARELSDRAYAHVQQDPLAAAEMARTAHAVALQAGDRTAQVAALHALGFAQNALADPEVTATLRQAIRLARRNGLREAEARARLALAGALAQSGSIRGALREIDLATDGLEQLERARSEVFRLGLLYYSEEPYSEPRRSATALRAFRRHDEEIWAARLLFNRGLVRTARGEIRRGLDDLAQARDLYEALDADLAVVDAEMAIADALLLTGDVPGALERLDAVPASLPAITRVDLELFRCRALQSAMLLDEALAAVEAALAGLRGQGKTDRWLRATLARAHVLSWLGETDSAARDARAAAAAFARRGQDTAAARARLVALEAAMRVGRPRRRELEAAVADADRFAEAGWRNDAYRAHLAVASALVDAGDGARARRHVDAAAPFERNAILSDRLLAASVGARLHLLSGDPAGAARTASAGLGLLDRHRLTLGSIELRARASALGVELATFGLRLAVKAGDPRRLLGWTEQLRANALLARPERPANDRIAALQDDLRRIERELADPQRSTSAGRLQARRASLEREITRSARHLPGASATARARPTVESLARSFGRRTLLEFFSLDGALHVVAVNGGAVHHVPLGRVTPVLSQLEWLRFGLRQVARADLSRARHATATVGLNRDVELIDAILLQPVAHWLSEEVVIAPGGDLAALPWGMLPSLRERAVSVVPSAALWQRLRPETLASDRRVALVSGPGLRHGRREIGLLTRIHEGATVLAGRDATVAATLAAVDGARIAHLATHGHFRSDSPLFSAFELADGSLSAHELCALEHPPEVIVLSACDLALSDAHPGDELLGLAATLLGLGTRAIIASVSPVSDRETPKLMRTLHELLATGTPAATALAAAQARHRTDTGAASFVCLGRG